MSNKKKIKVLETDMVMVKDDIAEIINKLADLIQELKDAPVILVEESKNGCQNR